MEMSYSEQPYATPPFNVLPPSPSNTHGQPGPQQWNEDDGTFQKAITHSPYVQRGTTTRFMFAASHILDGAITTYTTGPTASILDRYRLPALASYFTVGTVAANPSGSNQFYADVQIAAACELEYFEIKWVATYTPKAAGSSALTLQSSRGFRVFQPGKGSRHYFYDTSTFGAR